MEGNSTNILIPCFSFLAAESPWTSIKRNQTLTTHNTNRHCRVRFYTFVGQPLSKQLYTHFAFMTDDDRIVIPWCNSLCTWRNIEVISYVPVNSKTAHPPRAIPGHLTRVKPRTVGNLTQNEVLPVGHLTFVSKRLSAVRSKRISQ